LPSSPLSAIAPRTPTGRTRFPSGFAGLRKGPRVHTQESRGHLEK
jgi:hypothetical protein